MFQTPRSREEELALWREQRNKLKGGSETKTPSTIRSQQPLSHGPSLTSRSSTATGSQGRASSSHFIPQLHPSKSSFHASRTGAIVVPPLKGSSTETRRRSLLYRNTLAQRNTNHASQILQPAVRLSKPNNSSPFQTPTLETPDTSQSALKTPDRPWHVQTAIPFGSNISDLTQSSDHDDQSEKQKQKHHVVPRVLAKPGEAIPQLTCIDNIGRRATDQVSFPHDQLWVKGRESLKLYRNGKNENDRLSLASEEDMPMLKAALDVFSRRGLPDSTFLPSGRVGL
jgi:hypothetical protein